MSSASSDDRYVVVPGDTITSETGFMQGYGVFQRRTGKPSGASSGAASASATVGSAVPELSAADLGARGMSSSSGELAASVSGAVERVNQLVRVRAARSRYAPEAGDVLVGRVQGVGAKAWRVDVGARQLGVLTLGGVLLTDGAQRTRTAADSLGMRSLLPEGALVACDVYQVATDGAPMLHTRSQQFGRLDAGCVVRVGAECVPPQPRHIVPQLPSPLGLVAAVLGRNGAVWLGPSVSDAEVADWFRSGAAPEASRGSKDPSGPGRLRAAAVEERGGVTSAMGPGAGRAGASASDRDGTGRDQTASSSSSSSNSSSRGRTATGPADLHASRRRLLSVMPVGPLARRYIAMARACCLLLGKARRAVTPAGVSALAGAALRMGVSPLGLSDPGTGKAAMALADGGGARGDVPGGSGSSIEEGSGSKQEDASLARRRAEQLRALAAGS